MKDTLKHSFTIRLTDQELRHLQRMIAIRQKNDEIPPEWQTAEGYLREAFLEYTRVEAESHGLDPEDEADPLNEISILAAIGFRILNLS